LLKEVEAKPGARTDIEPRTGADPRLPTREEAATRAGLSIASARPPSASHITRLVAASLCAASI
jgi:hypothetical protein